LKFVGHFSRFHQGKHTPVWNEFQMGGNPHTGKVASDA
jgi:hypothetical protein